MTLHEPIGKFHAKEICQLIITRLLERRLRGYRSSHPHSHTKKKITFSCASCIISKPPDFYISTDHHDLKIKLFQKAKKSSKKCSNIQFWQNFNSRNIWIFAPKLENILKYFIQKKLKNWIFIPKIQICKLNFLTKIEVWNSVRQEVIQKFLNSFIFGVEG